MSADFVNCWANEFQAMFWNTVPKAVILDLVFFFFIFIRCWYTASMFLFLIKSCSCLWVWQTTHMESSLQCSPKFGCNAGMYNYSRVLIPMNSLKTTPCTRLLLPRRWGKSSLEEVCDWCRGHARGRSWVFLRPTTDTWGPILGSLSCRFPCQG